MCIDDPNINLDVTDKDSSQKMQDITVSNIFLKNEKDKCKFALFHLNLDHSPRELPEKRELKYQTQNSSKKIDDKNEHQETQTKNNLSVEYNMTNIFSVDLDNTTIVNRKKPNSKLEKKNKKNNVHFAPNNLGGSNLEPKPKKETLREKEIKESKYLVGRHYRGLKHISGYIKDLIIVNKSTTYPHCAQIISSMFAAELKLHKKTSENFKTPEMIEKEERNITRRVYDA